MFLIVALFAIGIVFILGYAVFGEINDFFQESDIISSEGKNISDSLMGRYPTLFDNLFMFIVIGLALATIAGAFFIFAHPALFWLSVPVMAFIIWLGGLFSNIFVSITTNDQVAAAALSFPKTTFIFNNFVMFIVIFVLLIAIALFAKQQRNPIQ